jgi:hypothetical protein
MNSPPNKRPLARSPARHQTGQGTGAKHRQTGCQFKPFKIENHRDPQCNQRQKPTKRTTKVKGHEGMDLFQQNISKEIEFFH